MKDYIQNLIQNFQSNYNASIFDRRRQIHGREQIANKMQLIKNYLIQSEHLVIAIDLEKDLDYLLVILSCLELKIPFIPIRKEWPESRKKQIQDLIGNCHFFNEFDLKKSLEQDGSEKIPSSKRSPSELAYIMFTSGTTGVPKGVMISRKALANFFTWIESEINQVNSTDRLLNTTDFTFDVSFADIGMLLTKHVNFYLSDFSGDLFRMLGELDQFRITVHCTTPNNYSVILGEDFITRADLSELKLALVCGSRFSTKLLRMFSTKVSNCIVYNCYGPTENTVYCTYKNLTKDPIGSVDGENVSIGVPFPGTGVAIINTSGEEVAVGEEGELTLLGNQLMEGYVGNSAETKKRLTDLHGVKCYKTGDIAYKNSNDEIFVLGRMDEEIKVNGQRVNLNDIECYIMNIESVKSCALLPIPDDIRGTSLVLYAVLQREMTTIEFRHQLETILIKQQVPQEIFIVNDLPVGDSGKISKKKLIEQYHNTVEKKFERV